MWQERLILNDPAGAVSSDTIPRIEYLKETYRAKYYVIHNFSDNERGIQYLLDYSRDSLNGRSYFVVDRGQIKFEDGDANIDRSRDLYFFLKNENSHFSILMLDSKNRKLKVELSVKKIVNRIELSAVFDSLNVNLLQNFIDYTDNDSLKKATDTYTYELYDNKGNKRVEQVYHDNGEWFTFDIIPPKKE